MKLRKSCFANILGIRNFDIGSKNREHDKLKHTVTYYIAVETYVNSLFKFSVFVEHIN
jgi:hypothetical protein